MKARIISTVIVVYMISSITAYFYFRTAYSTGGRYDSCSPDEVNIAMTFTPVINSVVAVDYVLGGCKPEKDNTANIKKFFGIQ